MESNEITQIVDKLKNLDLSTYPQEEILAQFKLAEKIPIVVLQIPPECIIIRGQNYDVSADYSSVSRHSYKPQQYNTTYQRASTPTETMFYGAITSLEQEKEECEEPVARQTILTEIGKTYRGLSLKETIVYSRWLVTDTLQLLAIVQNEEYQTPAKMVVDLQSHFKSAFSGSSGVDFMNFIAAEFAKEDIKGDFDYMISAWYSKVACDLGYDGVAYPSVRIFGAGMNLAIKPSSVDAKLEFLDAIKCDFVKDGKEIKQVNGSEYINVLRL